MPPSSISRALEDLARRNLLAKHKKGHKISIECFWDKSSPVENAHGCLRNPIALVLYARKDGQTALLPLAGESALSQRSMLATPRIEQRAVSKNSFTSLVLDEVLPGELSDEETVQIQVWTYEPLVAGGGAIDDVSLALTLAENNDERIGESMREEYDFSASEPNPYR